MKKLFMATVLGVAFLLAGCGDNGIYGDYKNEQYGLTLKISEKNIEFKGMTFAVESWSNNEKEKTYTAHGSSSGHKMNLRFVKKGSDVVYQGALFKAD
ncbi:hypothetical protein ACTHEV_005161 [Klebsiella pneumoniae]|uniref:hypothetical protein n=1 Tax=Klebsiella pneumoniae TaxID=573 RepID=UPI0010911CDA|nr:hypothetical protein [Klebsiella pneumoniae]VGB99554.1 Uncharacterised protein [Klebsiella pneumoniae]